MPTKTTPPKLQGETKMKSFARTTTVLDTPSAKGQFESLIKKSPIGRSTPSPASTTKNNPQIVYSSADLTDEQLRVMWEAHPDIANDEVIDSL